MVIKWRHSRAGKNVYDSNGASISNSNSNSNWMRRRTAGHIKETVRNINEFYWPFSQVQAKITIIRMANMITEFNESSLASCNPPWNDMKNVTNS